MLLRPSLQRRFKNPRKKQKGSSNWSFKPQSTNQTKTDETTSVSTLTLTACDELKAKKDSFESIDLKKIFISMQSSPIFACQNDCKNNQKRFKKINNKLAEDLHKMIAEFILEFEDYQKNKFWETIRRFYFDSNQYLKKCFASKTGSHRFIVELNI